MKISVSCPSYKRPLVETLDYLPFCKVWVDEGEFDSYVKANKKGSDIISCAKGIQGNMCRIRNHIIKTEFERGIEAVCIIDDDMKGVYYWENKISHMVKGSEFLSFIEKYSDLANQFDVKLWGLNINQDKQVYREYTPFSMSSFIGAPFMVFMKGNDLMFDERLSLKEDYDMTLQQLNKYRKVLRINKYFYNVKQSEQVGGCSAYRNFDEEKRQLELLQKKWGSQIVKIDKANRSHNLKKGKSKIDYNPIIRVPIGGV